MNETEKKENLANARLKLKKFRDQQPNVSPTIESKSISSNHFINQSNGIQSEMQFNNSNRTDDKVRRDIEHFQEQLEVHVQTIGVLVAEKSDLSAKLSQSFKQLERKQSELDELYGRLKASRERVQELEKQILNSTSDIQKRESAAKESDKENDRLKLENIRLSQTIEDFKQTVNQLNAKLQTQTQSEEKQICINRLRSDNEQYLQVNAHMQHHIEHLNNQISEMKCEFEREKELFENAIDQWANRYEDLKLKYNQTNENQHDTDLATENIELKQQIHQLEQTISELQTETDQIGDYIELYQQQRQVLQNRSQDKDQLIQQLTRDRDYFQKQLLMFRDGKCDSRSQLTQQSQPIKLAFNENNYFLCSTCTGSIQSV